MARKKPAKPSQKSAASKRAKVRAKSTPVPAAHSRRKTTKAAPKAKAGSKKPAPVVRKKLAPGVAAERGVARATTALKKKDWQTALTELAGAVEFDPFRTDWMALINRALDLGGKKAAAFLGKTGRKPDADFRALSAYAAHRRGDDSVAFREIESVTSEYPHTRFIDAWAPNWLTEKAIRAVGQDAATRLLVTMVNERYPEPAEVTNWGREQLGRAVEALGRVEAVHGLDDVGVLFKGQMLSKAGRHADAIAVTERAATQNPTYRTATAAAMAHKRHGDIEAAISWFRRAADLDTANETCLLDIGDIRAEQGKRQDALNAYEEAMQRVPDHDWAYPSAVYCRYRVTSEPKHLEELRYMANAGPDECGMAGMMKQLMGGYNFEDRRIRAEVLMKLIEPDFVPTPRPHDHGEDEEL